MGGECADCREVEAELAARGYPDPAHWLENPLIRKKIDETCQKARAGPTQGWDQLPVPASRDEETLWRVILAENAAYWNRNFPAFARHHPRAPYERFAAFSRGGGPTLHTSWESLAEAVHKDIAQDPDPNPIFAFHTKRENITIRVGGDMAFAAWDESYPTLDLPGFRGPSSEVHHFRVLERHEGEWKIIFFGAVDFQFGQSGVPTWEIDAEGRILRHNPAAAAFLEDEVEITVREGRFGMRHEETNARLRHAIRHSSTVNSGIMACHESTPVVYDPGNDEPARVWWVTTYGGRLTVSFNDPDLIRQRVEVAALAHRLSPAQQRLAASIVEGLPLPAAARLEGIKVTTARTQLQRIFDKLGVRTQPALVRSLLAVSNPQ